LRCLRKRSPRFTRSVGRTRARVERASEARRWTNAGLRLGIAALGLTYAGAIVPTVKVCTVAEPQERVSVKTLALGLPKHAWRAIIWREGSAEKLTSRFARVRVRTAPSKGARELGDAGRPEETLLIEWPLGEAAPTKYWLSNLPAKTKFRDLVDITKMRWRIERDYRGLRLPDLPTGEDSPLSTTCRRCARETCLSRRLPTPWRRRSGRSATSPTQSPPCITRPIAPGGVTLRDQLRKPMADIGGMGYHQ
jgi:hypothetical protein